jgi:hypothetical protein
MARGPEGKIQDEVIKYARKTHNAFCKKNEKGRYGSAGFLDFSIYPDRKRKPKASHFVIEFKAPGEDYTPLQRWTKDELVKRGHKVYLVSSAEFGKQVIDKECGS